MDASDKGIVILVDSREQRPPAFPGFATERVTLSTGDYSVVRDGQDLRDAVAIERKSVSDLLGCIGGRRERFERELCRLGQIPFRALIIEDSMSELVEASRRTQMTPKQVLGSVLAWQFKYHILVTFCSGRHYAAATVRTLLLHGARYAADESLRRAPNMVERAIANELRPIFSALVEIADVLVTGRETHPGDDWAQHPVDEHLDHARAHLDALSRGDTSDNHLQNAACRLLLALEVRDR
jgi:DNA excision repair protein ERCC-4